jgi:hypothetical protein
MGEGMYKGIWAFVVGAMLSVAAACAVAGTPASDKQLLREDDAVIVGGITEHWKLVWRSKPSLICVPEGEDATNWYTCPCEGYAFGEAGGMDLVRSRPGKEDEVFRLTPLFKDSEWPAGDKVVLQKWPVEESDDQWHDDAPADVMSQIRKREPVKAMWFADYDRDGQPTEFLVQVSVAPCGKRAMTLIGACKANPALHVFGTADHPDKPLILYAHIWQELLDSKGDVTSVEWPCGDHGAEEQTEVRIWTDKAGIHATRLTYECDDSSARAKLRATEVL